MPVTHGVTGSSPVRTALAKIAQLVEHDLAKVGVAGSSPVFRSFPAQMAESVDALVSNTSGAIHPGSIPGLGTFIDCGGGEIGRHATLRG